MTTQSRMILAAASVAQMMPARPKKTLLGNRDDQLVYSVYESAAKAAYVRAAQECLNAAYTAAGIDIDFAHTHEMIADESISLDQLKEMCVEGYVWGSHVVTLKTVEGV